MELRTWTDIKTKIQGDYDLADENFVNEAELVTFANEGIDDAETAIHTMHWEDKYFLAPATITLVNGTRDYAFPSNIYGNKVRLLQYVNGATIYEIKRIRQLNVLPYIQSGDPYQYLIVNEEATGAPRIRLFPTPTESGAFVTNWHVRNMKRMTTSASATNVCEIPECINFLYQHMRHSLAKKTRRADLIANEKADLKVQYGLMIEALKEMTVDEDNLVIPDLSSYYDQQGEDWR